MLRRSDFKYVHIFVQKLSRSYLTLKCGPDAHDLNHGSPVSRFNAVLFPSSCILGAVVLLLDHFGAKLSSVACVAMRVCAAVCSRIKCLSLELWMREQGLVLNEAGRGRKKTHFFSLPAAPSWREDAAPYEALFEQEKSLF